MKKHIRLIILAASLVIALTAGLGWATPPVDQSPSDYPFIAANGHGPGNGTGNGGDGPKDGTGHGPGDCSMKRMMEHSGKALHVRHGKGNGHGHGPGDGTGNGGNGPRDGSGNGPGDCTGPINS